MLKHFSRKKKKKVWVEPEEVFQSDGMTMARYGRFILMRNTMTPSQHKAFKSRMAKKYPEYCKEIDELVLKIRDQVRSLDPLTLLQCGYFNLVQLVVGKKSESEYGEEEAYALRMLDYIQSVIASTPGPYSKRESFDQQAWENLYENIKTLYGKLTPWFQIVRSAFLEANEKDYDPEYDSFCVQAEALWLNVRGDRYSDHDIPHLRDLLAPHDEVFRKLFGISTEDFVRGIGRMQSALTYGLVDTLQEMAEFRDELIGESIIEIERNSGDDLGTLMRQISQKEEWRHRRDSIAGRFFGFDLFDVEKVTKLPVVLLEQLAWGIGEEKEFFAPGQYSGWPLRVLPISIRPFLRVEDRFYCFDLTNLTDQIYRVMQRLVVKIKPEYRETWNERQRKVSEEIPFRLLERLMPGCTIYKNVYYRAPTGTEGKTDWCELDGLMTYDDHLIVAEVKAGAFTYTPPATDFNSYITSVKDLILKPSEQAIRFVQCLKTSGGIDVHDAEHRRIATITKDEFRHITPCCITIDDLTELAARADKLGGIGVVVPKGVWCTSVNDLRVYADLFDSPVVFTHFLEQRCRAAKEKTVELWDELDHLGLYLKHNCYTEYIKEFVADVRTNYVNWVGYRKKIDDYYYMLMVEPKKAHKPIQDQMKGYFAKIVGLLGTSKKSGRCKAASCMLDMSGEARSVFNSMIAEALSKQDEKGRMMPVSLLGGGALTAFCHSTSIALPTRGWMHEHALKRMLIANEKVWLSIILTFDSSYALAAMDFEHLYEDDISPDCRPRLEAEARAMQRQEVGKTLAVRGNIRRNELCPCGSGRKYKKCCGRLGAW